MLALDRVSNSFSTRFRTESGREFFGTLSGPDVARLPASNFVQTRRLLRVPANTYDLTGLIVLTPQNDRYLAALHHDSVTSGMRNAQYYRLISVNKSVVWQREKRVRDSVTDLARTDGFADMGTLWVAIEPLSENQDSLRVPEQRFRIVSGAAIQESDRLDNHELLSVRQFLGVYVAEAN